MLLWVWVIIALIAALVEIFGSGLLFIGVAGAAAIAAVVAGILGGSAVALVGSSAAFAIVAVVYLVTLRPPVLRLLSGQRHGFLTVQRGGAHIVGRRGVVTQTVSTDGGQIRIGQGEFWSARAFNPDDVLPEGSRVEVLLLDGLTALVAAVDEQQTAV